MVHTFRSVSHPSPSDKVSTGAAASDVAQDRGLVARRGDHESGIASGRYRDRRQKGQAATADPPQRSTYLVLMPDLGGHQRSFANVNGRLPFKVCHFGRTMAGIPTPLRLTNRAGD